MRRFLLPLPLALFLAACGARHEGTVAFQVRLKPNGVTGNTIANDVHVAPDDIKWKTFLSQAENALEEAPTHFEVTGARIQLDAMESKNVDTLQDVVLGDVTAFLRSSETGTQVDIAKVDGPKGNAQVAMDPTGKSLESLDANLARGDFRLGLRGSTAKTPSSDFEGVITLTLDITAR